MTGKMRDPYVQTEFYTKDEIDALLAALTTVDKGTYNPTFTSSGAVAVTNMASDFNPCARWIRVGNQLTIACGFYGDVAGAGSVAIELSFPSVPGYVLDPDNGSDAGALTIYDNDVQYPYLFAFDSGGAKIKLVATFGSAAVGAYFQFNMIVGLVEG